MTRISLKEEYDNKDVIQQIYGLKDRVEDLVSDVDGIEDQAATAMESADEAMNAAMDAQTRVATATEKAESAVASGSVKVTDVDARLSLVDGKGVERQTAIPIASASQTGMMNAQTYAGIMNLQARVAALEGKATTVYVTFSSNSPSEAEITAVFTSTAGRAPVAGDYAVDIARNLTYGYDGSKWTKVTGDVSIPQFSQNAFGLIKGKDAEGCVFAESDGTGSVKGWDTVKEHIATSQTEIDGLKTGKQNALAARTVTLSPSGWSGNSQTVIVDGMKADSIVWVSPAPDSYESYSAAGVRATAQAEGSLTFVCINQPTTSLNVEVVL